MKFILLFTFAIIVTGYVEGQDKRFDAHSQVQVQVLITEVK